MKRRNLLALLGASTIAGGSAVLSVLGDDKHTKLNDIMVQNRADKPQQVVVQVFGGDTIVTDETFSLAKDDMSGSKAMVPCEWRDASGPLSVRVRLVESSDWDTRHLDEATDSSAVVEYIVVIGGEETPSGIDFYISQNSEYSPCSDIK